MTKTEDKTSEVMFLKLPPPPPLPDYLFSNNLVKGAKASNDFKEDEIVSLEKAVKRVTDADSSLNAKPFYSCYTHIQSQLQDGPKCGLVALSIATSTTDCFKSADELFVEALNLGYTTQGEMYDCHNLCDLAERTTLFKSRVIENGINTHLECILHCIQNGGLMLVPYDADCNHSPCCRGGRSAHWAVMSGFVIFSGVDDDDAVVLAGEVHSGCQCVKKEISRDVGGVRVITDGGRTYVVKPRGSVIAPGAGTVYLAGKQGKSRHLALWPMEKLSESNLNLNDLSEQQKMKNFALPEGGVAAGLRGKAVLLYPSWQ